MATKVVLSAERRLGEILIDVGNRGAELIAVVNHPHYLTLELEDEARQFVRGVLLPEASLPPVSASSYVKVPPRSTAAAVFRLPLERGADGSCVLGALRFIRIPALTKLRVTYKAEMVMPNLPKALERSFFRGPAESAPLPLDFTVV